MARNPDRLIPIRAMYKRNRDAAAIITVGTIVDREEIVIWRLHPQDAPHNQTPRAEFERTHTRGTMFTEYA